MDRSATHSILASSQTAGMEHASTDEPGDAELLVRLKEQFVARDYASYSEVMSRKDAAIISIRTWQITVIGGLVVVLYSQDTSPSASPSLPLWLASALSLIAWFGFLAQEANELVFRDQAEKAQIDCEKLLSVQTLSELRENLITWRYSATRSREELPSRKRWAKWLSRMAKLSVLIWHVPALAVLIAALIGRYAPLLRP